MFFELPFNYVSLEQTELEDFDEFFWMEVHDTPRERRMAIKKLKRQERGSGLKVQEIGSAELSEELQLLPVGESSWDAEPPEWDSTSIVHW